MKLKFLNYELFKDTFLVLVNDKEERTIEAVEIHDAYHEAKVSPQNTDIEDLLYDAYEIYSADDNDDPIVLVGITLQS